MTQEHNAQQTIPASPEGDGGLDKAAKVSDKDKASGMSESELSLSNLLNPHILGSLAAVASGVYLIGAGVLDRQHKASLKHEKQGNTPVHVKFDYDKLAKIVDKRTGETEGSDPQLWGFFNGKTGGLFTYGGSSSQDYRYFKLKQTGHDKAGHTTQAIYDFSVTPKIYKEYGVGADILPTKLMAEEKAER